MAQREHAVFVRTGAVETPLGVAEGLGVLALEWGFGSEVGHELFAEGVVDVHVFGGQDDDASGEPVASGVHAGFLFPGGGAWSGGFRFVGRFGWGHGNVSPRLFLSTRGMGSRAGKSVSY